ncbi:uncharacterized protein LOC129944901 [Eupeodes corollae]|uniref:uncharacterized protein LOC129944901 n=1 Tax=Eupeodes corollae TaxID=290404 RepID=UPI0024932E9D|nr:uncharacterized protein LOC129944901 [Eupeodes corollae]
MTINIIDLYRSNWASVTQQHDVDWKKKWKNLKDSYVKYLKSEHSKNSTRNSNKSLRRYRTWPWASKMEFVRPFCKFSIPSESNATEKQWYELADGVNSDESLKGFPETELLEDPYEQKIDIKLTTHFKDQHLNIHDLDTRSQENEDEFNTHSAIQHINIDSCKFDAIDDSPKKAKRRRMLEKTSSTHNDIELILMGYAKTIKTFSAKRQTMVKFKFSQILMEAELEQQEEDQSNINGPLGPMAKMQFHKHKPNSSLCYESSN